MLRQIGGEHLAVDVLMGPGVDPHLYKPTPGDRRRLNAADIVFYSGLHLEGRLAGLLEKLPSQKPIFAVTEVLLKEHKDRLRAIEGGEATYDPHVWFDVSLWARCVDYAAARLIEVDPANAADYRRNAERYPAPR
jgi:manganese/zinc/iron transport system substrate-binding protein